MIDTFAFRDLSLALVRLSNPKVGEIIIPIISGFVF
jgi:hypothetical protein